MPNWSKNKLSVMGLKEEVDAFVKKAEGPVQHFKLSETDKKFFGRKENEEARISVLSFHQLVPIPDHIMANEYDQPDQRESKNTGYDWEKKLWGVKWGASEEKRTHISDTHVLYDFQTPWGPPCKLLETVSKEFPNLLFLVSYSEECPTRGRYIYFRGRQVEEIVGESTYPDEPEDDDEEVDDDAYQTWADHYYDTHLEWIERETQ